MTKGAYGGRFWGAWEGPDWNGAPPLFQVAAVKLNGARTAAIWAITATDYSLISCYKEGGTWSPWLPWTPTPKRSQFREIAAAQQGDGRAALWALDTGLEFRRKMRKVTFGGGNSLDNFIARKDHATDWLSWSEEVASFTAGFWKTIDTVVMGRKTYEVAVRLGTTSYPGVKNYVFSRTMKETPDKSVEIISEDAAKFVRKLKRKKGKGICVMGGGELAHSLFEADLIDEVGCNIHPVLLGQGIPLFHEMNHQIDLKLLQCKTFKNGCVLVTYRVKH